MTMTTTCSVMIGRSCDTFVAKSLELSGSDDRQNVTEVLETVANHL